MDERESNVFCQNADQLTEYVFIWVRSLCGTPARVPDETLRKQIRAAQCERNREEVKTWKVGAIGQIDGHSADCGWVD